MGTAATPATRPLADIRVVELATAGRPTGGRLLAELGADVVLAEQPGADDVDGLDLRRAIEHAGKRSVTLDLDADADRQRLVGLLGDADVLLDGLAPGALASRGLGPDVLRAHRPGLVITSVTDFGQDGPRAHWRGADAVHLALSGVLARSGLPGRPPLLPPGELAYASAATQAAWATVLALLNRDHDGHGDHLDVSALEATMQLLDPPFGVGGTASMGSHEERTRGRPDVSHRYPIFPCSDGWARLAVLSARQWEGLFEWLGEPDEFADSRFSKIGERFAARDRLYPLIADLLRDRTRHELVAEATRHGLALEPVLDPSEVLDADHFHERGALAERELAHGRRGLAPTGHVEIDDVRHGPSTRAPSPGQHTQEILAGVRLGRPSGTDAPIAAPRRPLTRVRVLDLGIIVAGAELGRILADQGAEVVKVESSRFLDGLRQAMGDATMSANFARAHRNKRSLGIDLRSDAGRDLLLELAARSDVVVSNFKPGTLEKLGLAPERFWEANPSLVLAESSALGHTGPWARRLGYGPLVRAVTGCTRLWRYPGTDDHSDAMTVYPDHMAARISALAIISVLRSVRRGGPTGRITVAQSEVILNQLAPQLLAPALSEAGMTVDVGADAPRGVVTAAGDDEWLAVSVDGVDDWLALCGVIGREDLAAEEGLRNRPARCARADELTAAVGEWSRRLPPEEAAQRLQEAGVACGAMRRRDELIDDDHLAKRGFFDELVQPELNEPLMVERGPARSRRLIDPDQRPAPLLGAHTREVLREVGGLTDVAIDRLLAAGIVEEHAG